MTHPDPIPYPDPAEADLNEQDAPAWVYALAFLFVLALLAGCIILFLAIWQAVTPTLTAPVGSCVSPLCM